MEIQAMAGPMKAMFDAPETRRPVKTAAFIGLAAETLTVKRQAKSPKPEARGWLT